MKSKIIIRDTPVRNFTCSCRGRTSVSSMCGYSVSNGDCGASNDHPCSHKVPKEIADTNTPKQDI